MPKIIALALALCLCGAIAPDTRAESPQASVDQADMAALTESIISDAARSAGLLTPFGSPAWVMEAVKNQADILVEFQHGPLPDLAAAEFGLTACARIAQNHVISKSPVRRMALTVISPLPDGRVRVYGTAIYNGNLAALAWENSGLNMEAAAAPKMPADARAKALAGKPAAKQSQDPGLVEEIVEEEVVVIEPTDQAAATKAVPETRSQTSQASQTAPGQQASSQESQSRQAPRQIILRQKPEKSAPQAKAGQKEVQKYPEHLVPGAIQPKARQKADTNCPYLQGLATSGSKPQRAETGCPYLDGKIPGTAPQRVAPALKPTPNCPYLQDLYHKKARDNAANSAINVNPAAESFEAYAQTILNDTAAETGLQDIFGNPAFSLEAKNNQANMMVQFRQGPLPEEAAAMYGVAACENLARAYIVKGLGIKKLALTVTCLLPNGGMNIYGTAIFNGNLDALVWEDVSLAVNPGPGQAPVPPLPYINQPETPAQQPAQKRQLNIQRAPQQLKPMPRQPQVEKPAAPRQQIAPENSAAPEKQAVEPKADQQAAEQPAKASEKEEALDNANQANQATYSFEARQIINNVVRAVGLQPNYGLPEYSVIAGDKKADIDIIFKRGPMSDSAAASFGLMACEQLARACIVKGLETRYLGVTVSYVMEDGRRFDYGTAVFNGSLDNLAWVVINRII